MTEEVIDSTQRIFINWREIWKYRELFYFFTWRDIKIKYKQTVLGFLWAVLQPALMMVIFTVFARTLSIQSNGLPYQVFVFSGLLVWNIFSNGLTAASNSIINNSLIIKKIYFPRLVIPVSAILVALFDFFMGSVLLVPLCLYFRQAIDLSALWLWPVSIVVCMLGTLGAGCWLAALNIKYRDFRYIIPFVVQVMFFVSPVIYPITMIDNEIIRHILVASPAYAAIELFRVPFGGAMPDPFYMTISLLSGLFFFVTGLLYFRKTEAHIADIA
jgi:lipopolysaccharide transport system permease protein